MRAPHGAPSSRRSWSSTRRPGPTCAGSREIPSASGWRPGRTTPRTVRRCWRRQLRSEPEKLDRPRRGALDEGRMSRRGRSRVAVLPLPELGRRWLPTRPFIARLAVQRWSRARLFCGVSGTPLGGVVPAWPFLPREGCWRRLGRGGRAARESVSALAWYQRRLSNESVEPAPPPRRDARPSSSPPMSRSLSLGGRTQLTAYPANRSLLTSATTQGVPCRDVITSPTAGGVSTYRISVAIGKRIVTWTRFRFMSSRFPKRRNLSGSHCGYTRPSRTRRSCSVASTFARD